VDYASIARCSVGENVTIAGSLSSYESSLFLGQGTAIAAGSEIGAEKNGCVILGEGVSVGPRSIISTTSGLIDVGARTSFFSDCLVSGTVRIGQGCLFANNVTVLSGSHVIRGDGNIRENDAASALDPNFQPIEPIVIGKDCWLGSNSVILPGITLGDGIVVGANTVVTKNFPDFSILGGVPAKVIGSRVT
jgi:acetyltransferase-like isoleucine patch superfamily enzyme